MLSDDLRLSTLLTSCIVKKAESTFHSADMFRGIKFLTSSWIAIIVSSSFWPGQKNPVQEDDRHQFARRHSSQKNWIR